MYSRFTVLSSTLIARNCYFQGNCDGYEYGCGCQLREHGLLGDLGLLQRVSRRRERSTPELNSCFCRGPSPGDSQLHPAYRMEVARCVTA